MALYNSCADCRQKCCKTGPGPYKVLEPEDYLENFGDTAAYNTKCKHLTASGRCSVWKTADFPAACRVYVCQSRRYTKEELRDINCIVALDEGYDDYGCLDCKAQYVLYRSPFEVECEICGCKWTWARVEPHEEI